MSANYCGCDPERKIFCPEAQRLQNELEEIKSQQKPTTFDWKWIEENAKVEEIENHLKKAREFLLVA